MTLKFTFAGILFGVLVTGCASRPLYSYNPIGINGVEQGYYKNGRHFAIRESKDGMRVDVAYEERRFGDMVFDASITNGTIDPIDVGPQNFTCTVIPGGNSTTSSIARIVDPEIPLRAVEAQLPKVSPVPTEPQDKGPTLEPPKVNTEENTKSSELQTELEYWKDAALRRTTLESTETVEGLLHCRTDNREDAEGDVHLTFSAGGHDFTYQFRRYILEQESAH